MKLLGSIKRNVTKNENSENVPYLEITEVVLKHYNVVNNSYQHNSRVLHTFVTNKLFCQLLDISSSLYFPKYLFQNFRISKYELLIKILTL